MAQVRLTDESDTELDTIPLVSLEKVQALDRQTHARIKVNRDDLNGVSGLEPGVSRVYIENPAGNDTFGGLLRSPGRGGGSPEMIVDSFVQYMYLAQGTPLGQQKVGATDDTLIKEAVDATPELSKGTINQVLSSGQTWVFSGISQTAKAFKVAEASGGEIEVTPSRVVNYGSKQLGSDKTATTLSPANQSFDENTFSLDEDAETGRTTHLSVYGVGHGTGQIEATIVPSDDSASYPNKVTYTNNDWTSGDTERWGRRTNKDIKRVSALQAWGQAIIEDLQNTETRVKTVVKDVTVNLGDTFTVSNSAEGLSATELRAVEVVKRVQPDSGTSYETVFSNHSLGRQNVDSELAKTQGRFEQAYEGDWGIIQTGPGRGPVGSSRNYVLKVDYPSDVIVETNAKIVIDGLNYRAFSQGAASGGDDTTASGGGATTDPISHEDQVTFYSNIGSDTLTHDTSKQLDSTTLAAGDNAWPYFVNARMIRKSGDDIIDSVLQMEHSGNSLTYNFDNIGTTGLTSSSPFIHYHTGHNLVSSDMSGETVTLDAVMDLDGGGSTTVDIKWWWSITGPSPHSHDQDAHTHGQPAHTHDVNPGILDFDGSDQSPAHYPKDVDVVINGNSEGTSFGDGTGEFHETHDITDELSTGENTIELTSDELGHLDAYVSVEVVRQSL